MSYLPYRKHGIVISKGNAIDDHERVSAVVVATDHAIDRFMKRVAKDKAFSEHRDIAKKYIELTVGKSVMAIAPNLGAESMHKPFRLHCEGVTYVVFLEEHGYQSPPLFIIKTCYERTKKSRVSSKQHIRGRSHAKRSKGVRYDAD